MHVVFLGDNVSVKLLVWIINVHNFKGTHFEFGTYINFSHMCSQLDISFILKLTDFVP